MSDVRTRRGVVAMDEMRIGGTGSGGADGESPGTGSGGASGEEAGTGSGGTAGERVIRLELGDITTAEVDAIVNAANSGLMGGGGVDGAIHRAGGPAILEECRAIVADGGRLPAGEAVITTGGRLAARHVIHTVGPVWRGGGSGEAETLASAYRSSLSLAEEHGLRTVAFPSISTGAYGYPVRAAADVALGAVAEALREGATGVLEVRFVLFDAATYAAYEEALAALSDG